MLTRILTVLILFASLAAGAEQRGQVFYGDLPLPGATVTAQHPGQPPAHAITDSEGNYRFADLPNGAWTFRVEMQLFAPVEHQVDVPSSAAPLRWDMELLSDAALAQAVVTARTKPTVTPAPAVSAATPNNKPVETTATEPPPPPTDAATDPLLRQRAADSLLIGGTVNNAAASPFAQFAGFGNNRNNRTSLYNGNLGVTFSNSTFDARAYSLTGQDTPKPAYNHVQGLFSFGGPLRIPHLLKNGPNFTINYQWTRNTNATTQAALVPTLAERNGDLSQSAIPPGSISPQARALLALYPLPNVDNNSRYNYQVPLVGGLHQDDLQVRGNKQIGQRDFLSASFAGQSLRTDTTNLFGFLDTGRISGINTSLQWRHRLGNRFYTTLEYRFTRFTNRITPYFANKQNISGEAGISGNNQDSANWGPPTLIFSSGIATLSDAQASLTRNQTGSLNYGSYWNRGRHNLQFGSGYGRQQYNVLSQQDPRGTFTFTGSDFASFLQGVPSASSIAYGNADKYLRAQSGNAYITDDWRQSPGFTLNLGLRWEYWSPVTEEYGRLVNLQIGPAFRTASPILGSQATLLHPDRSGFAPRLAFSWRPFSASSMVVRGGYGIYYDTGVYQPIALQMAQQAPISKSLRVQNSSDTPLTLANGFPTPIANNPTFAVDPDFRIGYSQTWQLSVQRDLPAALQMVLSYVGTKGTHAQQQFLPNTFPPGSAYSCDCPTGFTYLSAGGNSIRNAAQVQLRRRLRSGFAAQLQYTFAKSLDDATLGGAVSPGNVLIAQNWLNLRAERGRSNFDQRHLLSLQAQYTSGMGLHGGALLSGWRGRLFKEWTIATQVTAGSGLPLTPIFLSLIPGTGVASSLRPDYTGAPLYDADPGTYVNRAAFALPLPGQWGNAGRNTINGPAQLTMTASAGRTFRATDKISLDFRVDASNPLNHVTYTAWNTIVSNAQFGLPIAANDMRSIQTTLRARF